VRDALPKLKALGIDAIGISPDEPAEQKKFDEGNTLGFPLLSDPDHQIASAFDVWGQKQMFGKNVEGIVRSAFLIDEKGKVLHTWYQISPKDTVPKLFQALNIE